MMFTGFRGMTKLQIHDFEKKGGGSMTEIKEKYSNLTLGIALATLVVNIITFMVLITK